MFAPALIHRKAAALAAAFPTLAVPDGAGGQTLPSYPVSDAHARAAALQSAYTEDGEQVRTFTPEEDHFVAVERLRYGIDFRYAAERYFMVNKGGERLEPLFPLWTSQELVLQRFIRHEEAQLRGERDDGCLATVLKARQLGVSTLAACLLVHRITGRPYTQALIASDVTDSSAHLFGMADILYRHLPWFLKPRPTKFVNSGEHRHLHLANETKLMMESGKAMRGQKVEDTGEGKGEMGRGKTVTAVHLSELSTWENPEQLDSALFPGIPIKPYVVGVLESTAKGRFNWWHKQWNKAEAGLSRFDPVFIPWYAEPDKWRLKAPIDWSPSSDTLAHATRCEHDAPRWLGHRVALNRDQLYWYERTKASYTVDERLAEFLTEYPADPTEAFQYSGRSVFTLAIRERIRAQARPTLGVITIEPAALAQERAALARQDASPTA
jgi:hypothetical protein